MINDVTRFAEADASMGLSQTLMQSRFGTSPSASQLRATGLPGSSAKGLAASGAASVYVLTEVCRPPTDLRLANM